MASLFRWILLLIAIVLFLAGLSTAFALPGWVSWQNRLLIASFVGERGFAYAYVPVVVIIVAWLLRRGHFLFFALTVLVSLADVGLILKPIIQASVIARSLPAQLERSFGPVTVDREAFSIAALFAPLPALETPEELSFSGPLKLDFYRAMGRTSPAPCVILLHGGGWYGGGHRDRRPFTSWLAHEGFAVATIDYRLIPKAVWPAQRNDVLAALAFLKDKAASLTIDPHRFVLIGRSAGGQLAEATGLGSLAPDVCGVVSIYGVSDFRALAQTANPRDQLNGWTWRELSEKLLDGSATDRASNWDSASAVTLVHPQSPPTLLIHGALDTLVPIDQSERLASKLAEAHRSHFLLRIPWAPHTFDTVNFDSPGSQLSNFAILWFLHSVTQPDR